MQGLESSDRSGKVSILALTKTQGEPHGATMGVAAVWGP
jgi:hypothetical protein